ncbi:MAG: precorrin-6y C5,15-methyltransferase (decarboxylating) subunit CbiE [Rhodospirillaceae bacterium]|jgi:precorrin-6B C5,15-methyltransferase / cobalt-precorrin-6B C5,C15-methyltransferase|nr:precorrin-6y C5,15-methyltransferase (decarboxylating) subunit CbiE [Rhodospirillaceae bacterium]MBT3628360.1 precorrin-6y C5,15-methyltransferase (decarboxylating) subunit CbiE [Rhodospirillaceae bacterium]MBT4425325.1 precorrin-6y C5,15-methyltransferase (decarboxylating) subunit CbiE [Rhodospirillaceae bacterium]MBT5038144.1 precorrin-6y C5,15-methyltransferase (decarboxylating) subunit CbiE [Rhodospirillaceae bacterium]MBT5778657.1 precorrin-6y C5,15-methyltransferase (decarboxylating) s
MSMETPWLTVVGLGEDGIEALPAAVRALIEGAEVLLGGKRHLAMIPKNGAERLTWRIPLIDSMADIEAHRGKRVVVMATGDPMHYGIAVTLARHFTRDEMLILPSAGALSLACARMGWPVASVECLTLHGRPLETLRAYLAPEHKLVILSHDGTTPAAVAAELSDAGYGASEITVFEHMGGDKERCLNGTAESWAEQEIADLNTIAVCCQGGSRARRYFGAPGLRDKTFENDGQLTKREIRTLTLSSLAPSPGALLWDVGAGAGSVAIEWMLGARGAEAIAIERDAERIARIARNAASLGVPGLKPVHGDAPDVMELLPQPNAIFIGGGLNVPGMVETCWARLKPGGRLVANAVSLESEALLTQWRDELGGTMVRINISRAKGVGERRLWRPLTPVTQWAAIKD